MLTWGEGGIHLSELDHPFSACRSPPRGHLSATGDKVVPGVVSGAGKSLQSLLGGSMGGSSRIQGVGMGWGSCCQEHSEFLQDPRVKFACLGMTENVPGDFSHPPAAVW